MHKDIDRCFLNMGCDMQKGLKSDPITCSSSRIRRPTTSRLARLPQQVAGAVCCQERSRAFRGIRCCVSSRWSSRAEALSNCASATAPFSAQARYATEKDYKIEVGTIHASGVSCLIKNPKLQRVSCEDQFHGGWRCYEHMEAPRPPPPVIGITPLPVPEYVTDLDINTLCRFMPEEEAKADPRCQTVAGFQSTNPLRK